MKTLILILSLPFLCIAQDININNVGSATVGADSSASGTGDVILQTKGLTGFRLLNGGNVNVTNKLGVNNSAPSAMLHINPRYAAGVTAAENVIGFTNTNGQSFAFNLSQTLQGTNPNDDVMMWGWNVDANTPNEPTLRFSMERQFGLSPSNFELMIESVTPQGGQQRPWFWVVDRTTGAAGVTTRAASVGYYVGNNVFSITSSEFLLTGPVRHQGLVTFETPLNLGAPAKQIKIIARPSDLAQSVISFGGTVMLTGGGQLVGVYGSDGTTLGDFTAGRIYSGGAGMGVSYGLRVASGSALKFSATTNPFDGADISVRRTGLNALQFYNPDGNVPTVLNASYDITTNSGGRYKVNGTAGVTVSGSSCVITSIASGIITGATCTP